jgi:anti-sigma-K factor RskA
VNLKEYIASGIIESYVMGLASETERAEFEQMCAQYPELVAERRKFEESLEKLASEQAVRPPKEVKAKILKAIITMENSKSPRSIGLLRFVAAAAVILLIGMVVLYYQVNQQNKDLTGANKALTDKVNADEAAIDKVKIEGSVVGNPNNIVVNMVGTKLTPMSIGTRPIQVSISW